jgi:hypothetical protein
MPKVSMIIRQPEYMLAPVLLLKSICSQIHQDFEVILLAYQETSISETLSRYSELLNSQNFNLVVPETLASVEDTVLATLRHITGEYVCFPDTESVLKPEFVLAMVDFLENSPRFGAVRCNGVFVDELDTDFIISHIIDVSKTHEGMILEALLTKETAINFCSWMVRRASLQNIKLSSLSLEAAQWDWQFVLPLAQQNQVGFVNRDLFQLVHYAGGQSQRMMTHYDDRVRYEESFSASCLATINSLESSEQEKVKFLNIGKICSIKNRIYTDNRFRLSSKFSKYQNKLAQVVESLGGDPKSLEYNSRWLIGLEFVRIENAVGTITEYYAELILLILTGKITEQMARRILCEGFQIFQNAFSKRRVYFYGGGAAAKDILIIFLILGLRPHCIWDKNATHQQTLYGIPVIKPQFISISESERETMEIIVTIGYRAQAEEIKGILIESGFRNIKHISESRGAKIYLLNSVFEFSSAMMN